MDGITIVAEAQETRTPTDPTEYDPTMFHPQIDADGRCTWCSEIAAEQLFCQGLLDPYVDDDGFDAQYADAQVIFLGGAS